MSEDYNCSDNLWVLVDTYGKLIHQTTDGRNLSFMRSLVGRSKEAGDDWKILHYKQIGAECSEGGKYVGTESA